MWERLDGWWKRGVGARWWPALDARSLAVFRAMLALVVLWDAGQRWLDVPGLYSEEGIFPRWLIRQEYGWQPWTVWGLWMQGPLGATTVGARWLLGVLMVGAVGLLVGWRTRWMTMVVWLLIVQLHNRNPFVLHGGDTLLRVLLFWLMFLPAGRCLSVDARRGGGGGRLRVGGVPAFGLVAQFLGMYVFTVLLKTGAAWRSDFTAVELALNYDQLVTPIGEQLRSLRWLLKPMTVMTMGLEGLAPLVVVATVGWAKGRTLWVMVMVAFHGGLGVALDLEIFPWVCVAGWLLLLPGAFWDRLRVKAPGGSQDGLRPCGGWVQRVRDGGLALVLALVVAWNVRTLDFERHQAWFPQRLNGWVQVLRLDQHWNMFAPQPTAEDGWFVILGTTAEGKLVDLFRGRASEFSRRPERIAEDYANSRWAKAFEHLRADGNRSVRAAVVRYLEQRWNAEHAIQEQLVGLEFRWMGEEESGG